MKKLLKCSLSLILAGLVVFSLTACKTKLSKTTVDLSGVKVVNGVSTNGGMTVVHGEYLYFINGTKTNSTDSLKNNTRSAICRVKYNESTGEVDENSYEVLVKDLVGYEDGSLHIIGDFLYYATPCSEKNNEAQVLNYKTAFMRYDLVNKKSYELFTTSLNSSDETISYAYYIVGDSLNLVVYEKTNATITSLKIDKKVTTNYVIEDVASCILSENYGQSETANETVDANSYVFYTRSPILDLEGGIVETPNNGNRVFKTSPQTDNSKCIYDGEIKLTLVSIRAGMLIYSDSEFLCVDKITSSDAKLSIQNGGIGQYISYQTPENVIFMNEDDGSISVLSYNTDNYQVVVDKIRNGIVQPDEQHIVQMLTKAEKFEFVTLATIEETIEDDKTTTDIDETSSQKFQILVYIADGILYKLKIAEEVEVAGNKEFKLMHSSPIKLSTTSIESANGLIVGEAIGNYIFVMAKDDDKNVYMHKIDLTIIKNSTEKAVKIAVNE